MSITTDIEKAASKLHGDIDCAEINLKCKKKTLAMVQKECDQAEEALHKAKMAQYAKEGRAAAHRRWTDEHEGPGSLRSEPCGKTARKTGQFSGQGWIRISHQGIDCRSRTATYLDEVPH